MNSGFTAEQLLIDEDFKEALKNPEEFELPENDIQFLMELGIKESDLRNLNKKVPQKRGREEKK